MCNQGKYEKSQQNVNTLGNQEKSQSNQVNCVTNQGHRATKQMGHS